MIPTLSRSNLNPCNFIFSINLFLKIATI